jgi:hypothetical protein
LANGEKPDNDFKKPIIGAKYLIPSEMKITRRVLWLTSQIKAKNIRIGRIA